MSDLSDAADAVEAEWYGHPRPSPYAPRPTLFDQPPAQRHSITSTAAGEKIAGMAGTLRERVLCFIGTNPDCTDEQIADGTGLNPSTARPRRVELLKADLIRQSGTAKTRSNRRAATWVCNNGPHASTEDV